MTKTDPLFRALLDDIGETVRQTTMRINGGPGAPYTVIEALAAVIGAVVADLWDTDDKRDADLAEMVSDAVVEYARERRHLDHVN
jgi:hypothetical protein